MKATTHEFTIGNEDVILKLTHKNHNNGLWKCEITTGYTGTGTMTGGAYKTMEEYIKSCVSQHTYGFNFFKYGYKTAKELTK